MTTKCLFCRVPIVKKQKRSRHTNHFIELTVSLGDSERVTWTAYCCSECTTDNEAANKMADAVWAFARTELHKLP